MINYDTPVDYSGYTVDQLQAAFVQSGTDLVTISNVRQTLLSTIGQRKAQVMATATVADMSPLERDALLAALRPQ